MELKFRAVAVEGFVHGGGGLWHGAWHASYVEAKSELEGYIAKQHLLGDSVSFIECAPAK